MGGNVHSAEQSKPSDTRWPATATCCFNFSRTRAPRVTGAGRFVQLATGRVLQRRLLPSRHGRLHVVQSPVIRPALATGVPKGAISMTSSTLTYNTVVPASCPWQKGTMIQTIASSSSPRAPRVGSTSTTRSSDNWWKGEPVREAISNVPTDTASRPITAVIMQSVDVVVDNQNAVLMLKARRDTAVKRTSR